MTFEEDRLLRSTYGALGGCVKGDAEIRLEISDAFGSHPEDCHILNDQGIGSCFLDFQHLPVCGLKLVVVEYGIERNEYARSESVGITAQRPDVIYAVASCLACSELRTGNIHSIGTAVNCCDADMCVSCRGKQFELLSH